MVQSSERRTGGASAGARDSAGRVPTGLPGLDVILRGGLQPNRLYLLEGDPGTGKTTLSLAATREPR